LCIPFFLLKFFIFLGVGEGVLLGASLLECLISFIESLRWRAVGYSTFGFWDFLLFFFLLLGGEIGASYTLFSLHLVEISVEMCDYSRIREEVGSRSLQRDRGCKFNFLSHYSGSKMVGSVSLCFFIVVSSLPQEVTKTLTIYFENCQKSINDFFTELDTTH
jgi:hypothetical protein